MATKHVAVCDGCKIEAHLLGTPVLGQVSMGGAVSSGMHYEQPSDWFSIGGKDFCSWQCVARFAQKQSSSTTPDGAGREDGE